MVVGGAFHFIPMATPRALAEAAWGIANFIYQLFDERLVAFTIVSFVVVRSLREQWLLARVAQNHPSSTRKRARPMLPARPQVRSPTSHRCQPTDTEVLSLARQSKLAELSAVMRALLSSSAQPPLSGSTLASALGAYAKAGRLELAASWLEQLSSRSDATACFNALLEACARRHDVASAEAWLGNMKAWGFEPDVVSYNTVLCAGVRVYGPAWAEYLVDRMHASDLEPDRISFSCVLVACSKAEDWTRAERWAELALGGASRNDLRRLRAEFARVSFTHGFPLACSAVVRTLLRDGARYSDAGRELARCSGLGAMPRGGKPRDGAAPSCSSASVDEAARLMEAWASEAQAESERPKVVVFNNLIDAYAKAGRVGDAEALIAKMRSLRVSPDTVSYNAVIKACLRTRDVCRAEGWLVRMEEVGLQPTNVSFAALVHGCVKEGQIERAGTWLRRLDAATEDILPVVNCYNAVIHAWTRQGTIGRALSLADEMSTLGVPLAIETFAVPVRQLAMQGNFVEAEAWLDRMRKVGLRDRRCQLAIVRGHLRVCNFEGAQDFVMRMCSDGVWPGDQIFGALLQHLEKREDSNGRARYQALLQCARLASQTQPQEAAALSRRSRQAVEESRTTSC